MTVPIGVSRKSSTDPVGEARTPPVMYQGSCKIGSWAKNTPFNMWIDSDAGCMFALLVNCAISAICIPLLNISAGPKMHNCRKSGHLCRTPQDMHVGDAISRSVTTPIFVDMKLEKRHASRLLIGLSNV